MIVNIFLLLFFLLAALFMMRMAQRSRRQLSANAKSSWLPVFTMWDVPLLVVIMLYVSMLSNLIPPLVADSTLNFTILFVPAFFLLLLVNRAFTKFKNS